MSRSNSDFGGYRGRRTVTDILRFIAITLTVVVVLVVAGLFFLQKYIVYTPDGPKLQLPALFQREENPGGAVSVPDPGSLSIVEQPPVDQPPVPGEEDGASAGYALQISVDQVINGETPEPDPAMKGLIVEMKDPMGRLSWHSEQAVAGWSEVNGQQAVGDALKKWNEGDVYTIARVHCFLDDTVPYYNNNLALRWAGQDWNWRDGDGLRWTSPGKAEVRAYNAALCGELAALGFDEIVLEEFYFPIRGDLSTIRRGEAYDSSRFTVQLEDFLTQVRAAVEPYGTKISLRVGRDTLAGEESDSGVTPQLLEKYADRIWVEEDGQQPGPAALLEPAGITGGEDRLVLITGEPGDGPIFQAVIPSAVSSDGRQEPGA